jgi:hypothetical protein
LFKPRRPNKAFVVAEDEFIVAELWCRLASLPQMEKEPKCTKYSEGLYIKAVVQNSRENHNMEVWQELLLTKYGVEKGLSILFFPAEADPCLQNSGGCLRHDKLELFLLSVLAAKSRHIWSRGINLLSLTTSRYVIPIAHHDQLTPN